jgi:hypothetical protein
MAVTEIIKSVRVLLTQLSSAEQWDVITHLIHDRLGSDPEDGVALTDPGGDTTYLFLVPPRLMERAGPNQDQREMPSSRTVSADRFFEIINHTDDPVTMAKRFQEELEGVPR